MPLDIITSDDRVKITGDRMELIHSDINDISIYEKFGAIRRVPVEAIKPYNNEPTISEPVPMPNYSALMNEATGDILDTRPVAKSYNLVPHDGLFQQHAGMLDAGELPTNNVEVHDRLYDGGLRAHRTIYFNDLEKQIGDSTDLVRCRVDVFNSVDMSWAFQVFSGAYRDLCRNTLVFGGQKSYQQKAKHTRNLSPTAMLTKASNGLEMWTSQGQQMQNWAGAKMTLEQFGQILGETICKKNTLASNAGQGSKVNEKLMNYLLHRFREEQKELGSTMWAGYNALTHWATHTNEQWEGDDGKVRQSGTKTAKTHMVQRKRNDDVRAILNSNSWNYLEQVAA